MQLTFTCSLWCTVANYVILSDSLSEKIQFYDKWKKSENGNYEEIEVMQYMFSLYVRRWIFFLSFMVAVGVLLFKINTFKAPSGAS